MDCINFSVLFLLASIESCSPEASVYNSANNELFHCINLLPVLAFLQLTAYQASTLGGKSDNTSHALDSALWTPNWTKFSSDLRVTKKRWNPNVSSMA